MEEPGTFHLCQMIKVNINNGKHADSIHPLYDVIKMALLYFRGPPPPKRNPSLIMK